ncbi:MAG: hypothetical protein PHN88_15545 [Ignavibacteria bacterium]|nr:hypothetical protein [Ignavibacteria bacterium]
MSWKNKLIHHIINEIAVDKDWKTIAQNTFINPHIGIHLAVFKEPYISLIYTGEKKIESRFSINKISPFNKVLENDLIILKKSGGPITGVFIAGMVHYFDFITKEKLIDINLQFGSKICPKYDPEFWVTREKANYATLIEIKRVKKLKPYLIEKKDRISWVVLSPNSSNNLFTDNTILWQKS